MGIVNVTPDSFSDGGRFVDEARALDHARRLLDDGADIVDVGGESTRPGAGAVSEAEEIDRVLPVVEALARDGAIVSVDTMKPGVMRAAVAGGCGDDQRRAGAAGARRDRRRRGVARRGVPDAHAGRAADDAGEPALRRRGRRGARLPARAGARLRAAGIAASASSSIPGFGFGKAVEHNFALLRELGAHGRAGYPVLAGWSRKSSLGAVTGSAVGDRLAASLAAALASVARGASIVRVHDVRPTVDALRVWGARRTSPAVRLMPAVVQLRLRTPESETGTR